jgi:hypothetical protein
MLLKKSVTDSTPLKIFVQQYRPEAEVPLARTAPSVSGDALDRPCRGYIAETRGRADLQAVHEPDRGIAAGRIASFARRRSRICFNAMVHRGHRRFNGDGNWDILWKDAFGDVAIWLMNGLQCVSERRLRNHTPSSTQNVIVGAVNLGSGPWHHTRRLLTCGFSAGSSHALVNRPGRRNKHAGLCDVPERPAFSATARHTRSS